MSGLFWHYTDPYGQRVSVCQYDTRADLPIFSAEVVNSDGEVVQLIEPIVGHTGLMHLVSTKRWKEDD